MTETIALPTMDAINELTQAALAQVQSLTFHRQFIIDDYPIGGRDRGKCLLAVDRPPKRGCRTVRRITTKYGHWCKPKSSTFRSGSLYVASGELCGRFEACWLNIGNDWVHLESATGDTVTTIAELPFDEPRTFGYYIGGTHFPRSSEEHLDAYNLWIAGIKQIDDYAAAETEACPSPAEDKDEDE